MFGLVLLAAAEMAVVVWFMYGQGFDRVSAQIVIKYGVLLIPIVSILLVRDRSYRVVRERLFGVKANIGWSYITTLVTFAATTLIGIGIPALVVFSLIRPTGPFEELWLMMGGVTVLFGALQFVIYLPKIGRIWYGAGFLLGLIGILMGLKAFVYSFF